MCLPNCQASTAISGAKIIMASISFQLMKARKNSAPKKLSALSYTVTMPEEIRLRRPSMSLVMRDMISPIR